MTYVVEKIPTYLPTQFFAERKIFFSKFGTRNIEVEEILLTKDNTLMFKFTNDSQYNSFYFRLDK